MVENKNKQKISTSPEHKLGNVEISENPDDYISLDRGYKESVEKSPATESEAISAAENVRQINITPGLLPPSSAGVKNKEYRQIEYILEDGLSDAYAQMTPRQQQAFKTKGEQTATMIYNILHKTVIKMKKIVSLITAWLKMLPNSNKHYLEQTAKLKADKIAKNIIANKYKRLK